MCVGLCILIKQLQILFGKKCSTNIYKWSFTEKNIPKTLQSQDFSDCNSLLFQSLGELSLFLPYSCLASPWHLSSQPGMCLCICEAGWAFLLGNQRRCISCCEGIVPTVNCQPEMPSIPQAPVLAWSADSNSRVGKKATDPWSAGHLTHAHCGCSLVYKMTP